MFCVFNSIIFIHGVTSCPEGCTCFYKSVICKSKNIYTFPQNIPNDTQTLMIKDRKLISLNEDNFDGLSQLFDLTLDNVSITTIPTKVFRKLVRLRHLTLVYSKVEIIEEHAFHSLSSLEMLDLRGNALSSINEIFKACF